MNIDASGLIYNRTANAAYEFTDLNRVASFCETTLIAVASENNLLAWMRSEYDVAESIANAPFPVVTTIIVKKDFKSTDTYTVSQMQQYLDNINYVIDSLPPPVKKAMPETMRYLTYISANNIEENLKQSADSANAKAAQAESNIKNTAAAFAYSGEIFAGGIL